MTSTMPRFLSRPPTRPPSTNVLPAPSVVTARCSRAVGRRPAGVHAPSPGANAKTSLATPSGLTPPAYTIRLPSNAAPPAARASGSGTPSTHAFAPSSSRRTALRRDRHGVADVAPDKDQPGRRRDERRMVDRGRKHRAGRPLAGHRVEHEDGDARGPVRSQAAGDPDPAVVDGDCHLGQLDRRGGHGRPRSGRHRRGRGLAEHAATGEDPGQKQAGEEDADTHVGRIWQVPARIVPTCGHGEPRTNLPLGPCGKHRPDRVT